MQHKYRSSVGAALLTMALVVFASTVKADPSQGKVLPSEGTSEIAAKYAPFLAVKIRAGVDVEALTARYDAWVRGQVGRLEGWYLIDFGSPRRALEIAVRLGDDPDVEKVLPQRIQRKVAQSDDTYFEEQWNLGPSVPATGTTEVGCNCLPVWEAGYTGEGIIIGFIDQPIEITHPDLMDNVNAQLCFDADNTGSFTGPSFGEAHGTAVAGLSAAVGNNGAGVIGIAHGATIASINYLGESVFQTDFTEKTALIGLLESADIINGSYGIPGGTCYAGFGEMARAALITGVTEGRGGKGCIYIFSAGNGRNYNDDSNLDSGHNQRESIAVASTDKTGKFAAYSEPGDNILTCAPGGDDNLYVCDLSGDSGYNPGGSAGQLFDGDYTNDFSGTSAAAPIVSGVVALMLDANPDLTWRDVQYILVTTAFRNDPNDVEWNKNGAGRYFSRRYGFGLVDAEAAVAAALTWEQVADAIDIGEEALPDLAIPHQGSAKSTTMAIDEDVTLEHVQLHMELSTSAWRDLHVILTSPMGTQAYISRPTPTLDIDDDLMTEWTYMSVRFWGETAKGTWKLSVRDDGDTITEDVILKEWKLILQGTEILPITIDDPDLPDIEVGVNYSYEFTATGGVESGVGKRTWSLTSGKLPDGLKLNKSTGVLSGLPRKEGSWPISIQVSDSYTNTSDSISLTLTVLPLPPGVDPPPGIGSLKSAAAAACSLNRDTSTLPLMFVLALAGFAILAFVRRNAVKR